jgi:glucose-6-phosphate isomerase
LFLQIVDRSEFDLAVPERPFGFRSLFLAQAQGDAQVLAAKGLPILTLFVDGPARFERIIEIFRKTASRS